MTSNPDEANIQVSNIEQLESHTLQNKFNNKAKKPYFQMQKPKNKTDGEVPIIKIFFIHQKSKSKFNIVKYID